MDPTPEEWATFESGLAPDPAPAEVDEDDVWASLDEFRGRMQAEFEGGSEDVDLVHAHDQMVALHKEAIQKLHPWLHLEDPHTLAIFGAALNIALRVQLAMNMDCSTPQHVNFHTLLAFTRIGLVHRDLCKTAGVRDPAPYQGEAL